MKLGRIRIEHGSGGALSRELVEQVVYPALGGPAYPELLDATAVMLDGQAVLTTDGYVVDPPFFPGGDIGRLSVFGTCNDLAVCGARPRWLSLALILEEGLEVSVLDRALRSAQAAAAEAGVAVVTGDTKVVPAGKGGGIYVTTAGVGERVVLHALSPRSLLPGDRIIVSADLGAHGIAVLAAREGLKAAAGIRSDLACLWPLCRDLLELGPDLHFMRDATRGGLASVLNEMVSGAPHGIEIQERDLPVDPAVRTVSGILGLEPMEIANEGVLVVAVAEGAAQPALTALRAHSEGRRAAVVGSVTRDRPGRVVLRTRIGGTRIVDLPRGLMLPRIC